MAMKTAYIAFLAGILLLASGCAEQPWQIEYTEQSRATLTYVVNDDGVEVLGVPEQPLVFEASTEGDGLAWLLESRERRSELNRFRYEGQQEDEDELRADRIMSQNWHSVIDGESRRGYDVLRDEEGDFEDWKEPQKSDKVYGYTVRYGYS